MLIVLELDLAETYRAADAPASAMLALQTATRLVREYLQADPGWLAEIDFRMGLAALDNADLEGAETTLKRAAAGLASRDGQESDLKGRIALNLAKVAFERGQRRHAKDWARTARRTFDAGALDGSSNALDAEILMARVAIEDLDYDAAHERLDRVMLGLEAASQQQTHVYADAQYYMGELELMRGCYASAERFTRQSLGLFRGLRSARDPVFARGMHRLGILCERMGDPAGAVRTFDAALALQTRTGDPSVPNRCATPPNPAPACMPPTPIPAIKDESAARTVLESTLPLSRCGYHQAALDRADAAVAMFEADWSASGQARALAQAAKGAVLFRSGDRAAAEPVLELAVNMMAEEAGGDHEDMPPSLILLAEIALLKADRAQDPTDLNLRAKRLAQRADRILTARRAAPPRRLPALAILARVDDSAAAKPDTAHCSAAKR